MTRSGVRDPGSGRAPPDTGPRIPDTVNEELERGDPAPRPPLRAPRTASQSSVHHGCGAHARPRRRRQYGDLHADRRSDPAPYPGATLGAVDRARQHGARRLAVAGLATNRPLLLPAVP